MGPFSDGQQFEQVLANITIAFVLMVVVAIVVERSLSVIFGYKYYSQFLGGKGLKVPITLAVCYAICTGYPFDAVAIMFSNGPTLLGELITAGFLAGGSKKIAETFGDIKRAVKEIQG